MVAELGLAELYFSLTVVSMFIILYTIPTLFSTIRASSQLLERYKKLRAFEELDSMEGVPSSLLNEWRVVCNATGYTTLLTDEISKLNNLRSKFLISEIAMIILGTLIVINAYTAVVASCIAALLLAVAITVVYSVLNNKKYIEAYVENLAEIENASHAKNDADDVIYG